MIFEAWHKYLSDGKELGVNNISDILSDDIKRGLCNQMGLSNEKTVMFNTSVVSYSENIFIAAIRIDRLYFNADPNNFARCSNTTRKDDLIKTDEYIDYPETFMWGRWRALYPVGSSTCLVVLEYNNNMKVIAATPLQFRNVDDYRESNELKFIKSTSFTFLAGGDIRLTNIKGKYLLCHSDLKSIMFFEVDLNNKNIDLTHFFNLKGRLAGQNLCIMDFYTKQQDGDEYIVFRAIDHYYHGRTCSEQTDLVTYISIFCQKVNPKKQTLYNNGDGGKTIEYEGDTNICNKLVSSNIDGFGCTNLYFSNPVHTKKGQKLEGSLNQTYEDVIHVNVNKNCIAPFLSNGTSPIIIETGDKVLHLMVGHSKIHTDSKHYLYDQTSNMHHFRNFVHSFMNVSNNYIPHLGSNAEKFYFTEQNEPNEGFLLCKGYIYCMYFCVITYDKQKYYETFDRELTNWKEYYEKKIKAWKPLPFFVEEGIAESIKISDSYLPLNLSRYNNVIDQKIFSLFFPVGLSLIPSLPNKILISGGEGDYYRTQIICDLDSSINSCVHDVSKIDWSNYNYKILYNGFDYLEIVDKKISNLFANNIKLIDYMRKYPNTMHSIIKILRETYLCRPSQVKGDLERCIMNIKFLQKLDKSELEIFNKNRDEIIKFIANHFDSLLLFV